MGFDRVSTAANEAERFARLRLSRSQRVGPVNFAQLMLRFGQATRALEALPDIVGRTGGTFTAAPEARVRAEWQAGHDLGARLLIAGDADYPLLLRQSDSAPPAIWARGPLLPNPKAVAMVGARNASAPGQRMAELLARELGALGFQIVSGMARGIDTRAHEAALDTGTIAVLGGGVDDIYPEDNTELYQRLCERGLILSESPPGYKAQARDFPRRNRIIAGLSLATIVVEAELRSGSLITARLAAEHNREVFAVPGSPLDPRARGANDLLRQGASLCESAQDVTRVLEAQIGLSAPNAPPFTSPEDAPPSSSLPLADADEEIARLGRVLMGLISPSPTPRDELVRLSGGTPALAFAALTELEIAGHVTTDSHGVTARV